MKRNLAYAEPELAGTRRAQRAKEIRDQATHVARARPAARTCANGEEADYGHPFPSNFTKGLLHDECGLLAEASDYQCFVTAINSSDSTLFDKQVPTGKRATFSCPEKVICGEKRPVEWRGWESPRAGHVFELEGPDAGAVGMAPAPRVGSSELAAEMAEVYGLALLRDVPFTTLCAGGGEQLCAPGAATTHAELTAAQVVDLLGSMKFYSGAAPASSTPSTVDSSGLNGFERRRRLARTGSLAGGLTPENVFRGSTQGAQRGPYLSQFLLVGADSLACADDSLPDYPGKNAKFGLQDGFVRYGSLTIDQRALTHKGCLDYMTDWAPWLDVQNGARFNGADAWEPTRRFITTPRDLATYVHYDALYQAYLNACFIMLSLGVPKSKGFPEANLSGTRDSFATFGDPHVLTLVTEGATRCLKAVRRQKFNYHRRARPEAIAGRFTLEALGLGTDKLGCSHDAFAASLGEIPEALLDAVIRHNAAQNTPAMRAMRQLVCSPGRKLPGVKGSFFDKHNLLLPMAFPEGSPMHPSYGAGHATVAGGCVTMLKAFFEMFEDCHSGVERPLYGGTLAYVPNKKGSKLVKDQKSEVVLTVQGELDKLAANIAIGRDMAGVHYYSDYYDSLRMGERVAVGMLLEQAPTYEEAMQTTFTSFDGDFIVVSATPGSAASLSVTDAQGNSVLPAQWWLRHTSGQEVTADY